jgi:endonuclease/exonuclease/phosphatase family metal-dependent hydrolase
MQHYRIGTLNCQNNADNREKKTEVNARALANHIIEKQYDILGTQELTKGFMKWVNKYLEIYNFYGGYQFGKGLIGKLPIIRDYNESAAVVTRKEATNVKTKSLPWFPWNPSDFWKALKKMAIKPRIATVVELEENGKVIYIINTHLDYYIPKLQKKQLDALYEIIKKCTEKGLVSIMGDFNLQITNPMFKEFERKLNGIGIRRVNINAKTNSNKHKTKTAIDHIFIPTAWKIADCGIFETLELEEITDHKALYVDVVF